MAVDATRLAAAKDTMNQALAGLGIATSSVGTSMLLAIAWGETQFGNPSLKWADSNNWGGVQFAASRGEPYVSWGYLDHPDTDKNGQPIVYHFQRYPSAVEGAKDMVRHILRTPRAKAAIEAGSPEELAAGMYYLPNGLHYFTGNAGSDEDRIAAYAKMIRNGMAQLGKGIPALPPLPGKLTYTELALGFPWPLLIGWGVAAYLITRKRS